MKICVFMFRLEYLFVIGVLYLGIVTSYTDIKHGKIRNKHLLSGIYIALFLNILLIVRSLFLTGNIDFNFYKYYLINIVFVFIVSVGLWKINIFTAGDAKLFFVMDLLVPPNFVNFNLKYIFYSMIFFINVFCVLFFYFIFEIFKKVKLEHLKKSLKKALVLKNILNLALFVFVFVWIFSYLPQNISTNVFISLGIMFFVYAMIDVFVGEEKIKFFVVLALVRLVLDFDQLQTVAFWKQYVLLSFGLLFLRFLLLRLGYYIFTKEVKLIDLKEGMKLAVDFVCLEKTSKGFIIQGNEEMSKILRNKGKFRNIYFDVKDLDFFHIFSSRNIKNRYNFLDIELDSSGSLTKDAMKKFHKGIIDNKFLFAELRVFEEMYFAPFIFLGFLLSIIIQTSIFTFLRFFI